MAKHSEIKIGGIKLAVSNLNKVLYPKSGFTKGEVIDFYIRVSEALLPHLKDRPITLKRYPNGVDEPFFYEKQCPSGRPKWMKTAQVPRSDGTIINYCVVNNLPGLVWAANLADLELHTFLHKAPAIQRPTTLAFDLDPGPPADILACCKVALHLKAVFEVLKLRSFPKTSGSKGMQIYVPLNTPSTYEQTKSFAHELATWFATEYPELVVSKMGKAKRKGKVFIDWSQNDNKKTTINVYSLRAAERPTVSTPVAWEEIEDAVRRKTAGRLVFESADVLKRISKLGDLFLPVLELKQRLPDTGLLPAKLSPPGHAELANRSPRGRP
jgi:bifunctional non-homologous end joining protein LigD